MKRSFFARPLLSMAAAYVTLAITGPLARRTKSRSTAANDDPTRTAGISAAHSQCQVASGTATHSL